MFKQSAINVFTSVLTFGLAACGSANGVDTLADTDSARAALNDAGRTALAQANVVEGDYDSTSNSAECLALRTKLTAGRKAFQATDVWDNLSSTAEYKAFEQDKVNFRGAGCDKNVGTPTQACAELQKKIDADGDAIAATAQWSVVTGDEKFKSLQENFAKAKEIDCVK